MMPNVLQYPVAIAAVLRAGYIVVNVNPLYTPRELEHQLKDSGAEAIVLLENFATTLQAVVKNTAIKHVVVAAMGDLMGVKGLVVNFVVRRVKKMVPEWNLPGHVRFNDALAQGARETLPAVAQNPDDVAFLQYTGGTTGVAKGATLLHRNLIANVLQSEVWLDPARKKRPDIDQFVCVVALPLYHIFALTVCGLLTIRTGGLGVLIPNPRDIAGTIKELKGIPINTFPAVNTLYNALLNHPDFASLDFSKLIAANGGGMAVQEAVAKRWFETTGVPIIEGYGLSETSPCVTCNPVTATEYTGTIGLAVPVDGNLDPRRRQQRSAARRRRRNLHPRTAGDGGLLEPAGRNGEGHDAGRLLQIGRRRRDGRARLREDRRSQEGHDPGVGLQRVSERDRGCRREAAGRVRSRGGRREGPELGRGGEAVHRQEGPEPDRSRRHRVLQGPADRLQAAAHASNSAATCRRAMSARSCRRELRDGKA